MVQLLILHYLSIKSTHGYEIQKFVQMNKMEEWNSIQSGSIYYALKKLQSKGLIKLVEKIGEKEKSKCIYGITEEGRTYIKEIAISELAKPLANFSSEKFLIYPIISHMNKSEMTLRINAHILELKNKIDVIDVWISEKTYTLDNVEKATFKLMKDTLTNQIDWHLVLLDNLDVAIASSEKLSSLIAKYDFSEIKNVSF